MAKKDPRVDAYIARSAEFARPILRHIRRLVHAGCPRVEETIKWGAPHFLYEGMLGGMAAFKKHCAFFFWHSALRDSLEGANSGKPAMGQLGRIASVADLPGDAQFKKLIKKAAELNAAGVKPRTSRASKSKAQKKLNVPADLVAALAKNKRAQATFDGFTHSNKKEYVEWITEAKRAETRSKRLATAIKWIAEGKSRNWKYR